jgi:hypothetical protein
MRISYAVTFLAVGLALSGCASDRISSEDTSLQPQPLEAQPVAPVEANQLPDPATDTSQFPQKPATDMAANTPQTDQAPATALDITKESMIGGWKVTAGGVSCQMFLTLTNLGSGSRGGTKGCGDELSAMASWEVSGKLIMVKDHDGNVLARIYKTAENQFNGSTKSGAPIALAR